MEVNRDHLSLLNLACFIPHPSVTNVFLPKHVNGKSIGSHVCIGLLLQKVGHR